MSKWRTSQDPFPRKDDEIVEGENLTQFFHFVYFPHSCSLHIFLIFILFLVAILFWYENLLLFISFQFIHLFIEDVFIFYGGKIFSCSYCCYNFHWMVYLHNITLFRWVGIKILLYGWMYLTSDMVDMSFSRILRHDRTHWIQS